ncbi:uncharacterized protein LOC130128446 [Lampris incognitus]|uniref:uncharacterized protein LOC130128446 n=1 Tax=Lampris incognitus TaxID=2546036 RepID=UPI0024B4B1D7|nr:uncharacterized protein LOC130128446 [Lampris incognitus]
MATILEGLTGERNDLNDIIIYGANSTERDARLKKVLHRLKEAEESRSSKQSGVVMNTTGQPWTVLIFCVAVQLLGAGASSPEPRSSHVTQVGQNVSLPCNLTSSGQVTWFHLRADHLVPLLAVHKSKLNRTEVSLYVQNESHFRFGGDAKDGRVSLELVHVNETDAGLYFCGGRCDGVTCFSRGLQLTVEGSEPHTVTRDAQELPCWTLIISLLPVWFLFCFLCIFTICFCSGRTPVCCSACVDGDASLKEARLHYASLKYARRPRPSAEGHTGLAEEDVTYSTVSHRRYEE